jgi:Peptidase family M48
MTPTEFLEREKDNRELFAWILRLVPPDGAGSPLTRLPKELEFQLCEAGIRGGNVTELYSAAIEKLDWAKDAYARMVQHLPAEESAKLQLSDSLAVGAIHDAEFNGFVHRCEPGFAICVPTGALMLISLAAELYCLNEDLGVKNVIIEGDYAVCGWQNRRAYRAARALQHRRSSAILARLYPARVGGELEFLYKNYSHLGVVGPPQFFGEFGILPMFPSPSRFGHPLEAGNHLREHAIRFLLMHECSHILKNHFGDVPSHEQEYEADESAFELGVRSAKCRQTAVGSLLGAWLVLAIARRIEAQDGAQVASSHPSSQERMNRLIEFVRKTRLLGFFTRQHALHRLRELERREATLVATSAEYRQFAKDTNPITVVVKTCISAKSDSDFMDQMPRWILQSPPARLFSSLAATRVEFERKLKNDPTDEDATFAVKTVMKVYDAAGSNTASTLYTKLQNAYLAEQRRRP